MCRDLQDLARGTTDDPTAKYVLLRMAYAQCIEAREFDLAREVIGDLARSYRVDALGLNVEVFEACVAGSVGDPEAFAREFDRAAQLIEESLLADRIELAERLLPSAVRAASFSGDESLQQRASRWGDVVAQWTASALEAQRAALRLAQQPLDGEARLALGRYLCLTKGQWRAGLALLAGDTDEVLAAAARSDLDSQVHDQPPAARLAAADQWRELAAQHCGLAQRRLMLHADEIYRQVYPAVSGMTRLKIEERMLSRPLFVFDSGDPPSTEWVAERLRFRGGHGREGSGSWAHLAIQDGQATLVANRAGFIETREEFPPPGIEHYQIEAELWSDLLKGTAFEFGGTRLYFGHSDGLHVEGGWVPNVIYPIPSHRFQHYLIDVSPGEVSFSLNGIHLGTMETQSLARGSITLRGWEGHVQCRRLVVWALPPDELTLSIELPNAADSAGWAPAALELYPGFEEDRRLMRQTLPDREGGSSHWSSGEAIAAAKRVFARFPPPGTSRLRVLEVLGEPNRGAAPGNESPEAPLIYRFDHGFGGVQFTIHFESDRVSRIEAEPLE